MTNRGTFARVRQTALQGTALAMLGIGGPALVQTLPQSYNAGIPTVSSGSIGTQFGSANETIFINSSTAVLNWTPTDQTSGTTPINFQNQQTSMTYQGIAGNFTVLNRIVPTGNATGRAIAFNGTVNSVVGQVTGGSVWFYSPGGIVLNGTAQFNVGNLLLTASDPIGGGTTITDPNTFAGGGTGEAGIVLNTGAQINALMENSYVALVAPRVFLDAGSDMRVNGQNALVGVEQAQLTINNGLFDIVVTTGSSANNGLPIIVRGNVGGPASTAATDPHAIYLVAVPKNVAATALIEGTGNIGFDVATDASITNGKVVLSNGSNIGQGVPNQLVLTAPALGDTNIGGGNFTSDVTLNATRMAYVFGTATNTPQFSRDLSLTAPTAQVGSFQANTTLNVGRNLVIGGGPTSTTSQAGIVTFTGATSRLFTSGGGRVQVGGNLSLFSTASVIGNASQGFVLNGGNADITTTGGGSIRVIGNTTIAADAIDQTSNTAGLGATATGGNAYVYADSGDILLDGGLVATAIARTNTSSSTTAALAKGGAVYIRTAAAPSTGRVVVGGSANLDVSAVGDRTLLAGGASGNAQGGIAQAQIRGSAFNVGGLLTINSSAYTDDTITVPGRPTALANTSGGSATGGTSQLLVDGATSTIGSLTFTSLGLADANTGGGNGVGGVGTGGLADIVASAGTLNVGGAINFQAGGRGGNKTGGTTGGGGAGVGGQTLIRTIAGVLNLGQISLSANGVGGTSSGTGVSGFGGSGTGGGARIDTPVSATGTIIGGAISLSATGTGGNATVTTGQTGGAGIGGTGTSATNFQRGTYIINQGGTFTLGGVTMNANAQGGTGAIGGAATGGLSQLTSFGGTVSASGATVITANANGGNALAAGNVGGGTGGAATAGTARASADYINFQSTVINQRVTLGATTINAIAIGGAGGAGVNGGAGGIGGAAIGGIAQAFSNASTLGITTTSMNSDTRGFGGNGGAGGTGVGGAGGAGTGGQTGGIGFGTISGPNLTPNTGLASFGNTTILASGSGGNGGTGTTGGAGGLGTGGFTTILSRGTPVTFGTLSFSGQGIGGTGAVGTAATGQAGSAIGGGLSFATTNRFERTERGLLVAGNTLITTGTQLSTGAPGATETAGWAGMTVNNGDVTFGTFTYNSFGTLASTDNVPALTIDVAGGAFGASGAMNIDSTGDAVISARDGGVISGLSLNVLVRGNILPRPTETPIGVIGTIATNGSQVWSAPNINLQSNLVAGGIIQLHAAQAILVGVTAGGIVDIGADDLTVGNVASANDDIVLHTQDTQIPVKRVVAGTLTAPNGDISVASDGAVTTGALFAGRYIDVSSVGALTINGSAIANALGSSPNEISQADYGMRLFSSDGAITTGNLTGLAVQVQQGETNQNLVPITTAAPVNIGNVSAEAMKIYGIGNVTTGTLTQSNVYQYLSINTAEYGQPILFAGALGNLTTANVTGTNFGLLAAGANLNTGNLNFTGSVAVTAGQNATIGQVTTATGPNDLFYAANTSVLFNDPLIAPYFLDLLDLAGDSAPSTPFSPSILLTSTLPAMGGALSVGNTTTGTVRAAAASASFANVTASQRFFLTTTGLAAFNGIAVAPRFDITSGDIAIGNAATIGNQGTAILNLNPLGSLVTIGGTNGAEGYFLSNAEASRLIAATITIVAQGSVMVRDLALRGSAAQQPNFVGQQAAFRIGATGAIRVEGAVALTGAAATDTFLLSSNQRIEVPTDLGGSFTLNGLQTNSLGGTLSLAAPVIAVATNNIVAQMAQDPRYAGRDAALASPSGNRPEGFLQANRIILTGHNVIAIQNSNTAALMGGFTTGSGGMTVVIPNQQQVTQPTDVRIYGRTTSATGAFVTNGDTLATVTRTANNGSFSATSAVNACLFTATTACAAPTTPPPTDPEIPPPSGPNNPNIPNNPDNPNEPIPISPAVVALVDEATDGDPVGAAAVPAIRIVRMLDETAIVEDAEVTDPVAGSANASVWDVGTDEDDDTAEDGASDAAPATPGAGGGR